jgi:pimeloyl-ACP methyl ester carboxylesterase
MKSMQRSFLADDGVRIAYGDSGPGGGPAIVLCHGICAGARQFEADAGYFSGHGHRVLVPDLRGHGGSGPPGGTAADFSVARLAADMLAMLDDACAKEVHWVGNSLGGIVGLAMLAQRPGSFASLATFGTA